MNNLDYLRGWLQNIAAGFLNHTPSAPGKINRRAHSGTAAIKRAARKARNIKKAKRK